MLVQETKGETMLSRKLLEEAIESLENQEYITTDHIETLVIRGQIKVLEIIKDAIK